MRSGTLACSMFVFVLVAPSYGVTQEAAIPTERYTVTEGDTCASIAEARFGNRRRHDIIHAYNPNMGPPPHDLRAGMVLVLPVRAPTAREIPDARVTAVRRDVQARAADASDWRPASRGQGLYRGWRVNALEQSSAQLTFQDTSVVEVRANTLVVVYGGTANAARATTGQAVLERGTLRSRLGNLRMRVDTPSSEARLDGGSAVVSVDERGTSSIANHDGRPARVSGRAGRPVAIAPGFGSSVRAGEAPSPPRPLPPAPSLPTDFPTRYAAIGDRGATITGAWDEVPGAARYHVEILRIEAVPSVVASTDVTADVRRFDLRGLPPGRYRLVVSTIDAEGLEGTPSAPLELTVEAFALRLPGSDAALELGPDASPSETSEPLRVLAGATLAVPQGASCVGAVDDRIVLAADQPMPLCTTTDGRSIAGVALEVVAPAVTSPDATASYTLTRGEATTVSLSVDSQGLPLPDRIEVRPSAGVEVLGVTRTEGRFDVEVRATADAAEHASLTLVVATSVPDAAETVLGTLALTTQAPPPVAPPPVEAAPEPERPRFEPRLDAFGALHGPSIAGVRNVPSDHIEVAVSGGVARFENDEGDPSGQINVFIAVPITRRFAYFVGAGTYLPDTRAPARNGSGDFSFGARGRLLETDALALDASIDSFWPTGTREATYGSVLVRPALALTQTFADRVALRARTGAILGMTPNAIRAAAVGLAIDLRLFGPLYVGIESDVLAGRATNDLFFGSAVGGYLGVSTERFGVSASARYVPNDDTRSLEPRMFYGLSLRYWFDADDGDDARAPNR